MSDFEWCDASIELPSTERKVLCCTVTAKGNYNYVLGYYDGKRWCCGMNNNVVAWADIPEYKS